VSLPDPPPKGFSLWTLLRSQWLLATAAALFGWAFAVDPEKAWEAMEIGTRSFLSVLLLVIAVFALIGLIQVWLSRDLVARLLGRQAGFRALLIAAACGTILIGPAYIIFPLLMSIRRQGARWAVVTIVLSAYAVKLHMIPIEVQFLGWGFSLSRSILTLLAAIPIGLAVEAIMEWPPKRGEVASRS
jgi:uncharacterized membrane protein YraQ (UPF0718 family)